MTILKEVLLDYLTENGIAYQLIVFIFVV